MLFIIDMQNDYLDREKGQTYIEGSENLIDGIIDLIEETKKRSKSIYYTLDMPVAGDKNQNNEESLKNQEDRLSEREKWGVQPYERLSPYLKAEVAIKKSYYALPPRTLLRLQEKFTSQKDEEIEFVGVETHICVLANAICIQSAFPQAKITIHGSLCRSANQEDHDYALKIMAGLGMEVKK